MLKQYKSLTREIETLIDDLTTNPEQGTSIGQGCYKIRLAIKSKGRGKAGGARVITCVAVVDERVILLSIYDKAEQADIADAFLAQLLNETGL